MNNLVFVLISLIVMLFIIISVKRSALTVKESFYWFASTVLMLILSIFPKIIDYLASLVGVAYPPSLLFVLAIVFLILMLFRCSKRISSQDEKIKYLIQEVAILKNQVEKK